MLKSIISRFTKPNKKTKIKYNSRLISKFEKEHKKIVTIVGKIDEAVKDSNRAKIVESLKLLKIALMAHFMDEDVNLYQYLKEYYKDDKNMYEMVIEFYSSIKDIQTKVLAFLDKYTSDNAQYDGVFEREFQSLVDMLVQRVESEETSLYTLYKK